MISILVPVYNGIEFLDECVESVMTQTFQDWELLVGVNGHSIDSHEYQWVKEIITKKMDQRITCVFQDVKGKVASLDHLRNISQGEYICVLDCDDVWYPLKLETQIEYQKNQAKDAAVIGTWCVYFGRVAEQKCQNFPSGYIDPRMLEKVNPIINSSVMMHRSWAQWRYPPHLFSVTCEDYDQWMRVCLAGGKLFNIPQYLVKHRLHHGSAFNTQPFDDSFLKKVYTENLQNNPGYWYTDSSMQRKTIIENLEKLFHLQIPLIHFRADIMSSLTKNEMVSWYISQGMDMGYGCTLWNDEKIEFQKDQSTDVHQLYHFAVCLRHLGQWENAWKALKIVLSKEENDGDDDEILDYHRYHLAGIVCFYVKEYSLGKKYLEHIIQKRNLSIDQSNYLFYP